MARVITGKATIEIDGVELSDNIPKVEVSAPVFTDPNMNEEGYPHFIPSELWDFCQRGDLDIRFGYFGMWSGSHFSMNMFGGNHKVVICMNQVQELSNQCGISVEESGLTIFAHEMGHYFDMKNRTNLYNERSSFTSHFEMDANRRMVIDCELGANYELVKLSNQFGFVPSMTLLIKGLESQKATQEELQQLYDIVYHNSEYSAGSYECEPVEPFFGPLIDDEFLKDMKKQVEKKLEKHYKEQARTIIIDSLPPENPQIPKEYTAKERKKQTTDYFKELYNGRFNENTRRARNVHKRKFR